MTRLGSAAMRLCAIFILITVSSAFQVSTEDENTVVPKKLITLNSEDFQRFSARVHRNLKFGKDTLEYDVFHKALKGYMYLRATGQVTNDKYLTVVDFTDHCNDKRMWVIDLINKDVLFNEMVAHGKHSGSAFAKSFSNRHRSNKSSLGFYLTGGTYYGRNGFSLKLNGVEKKFNGNAFSRGIVIHGAHYVSQQYIQYNEKIGRSFGCPAVSKKTNKALVNTIKGGSCLFIYHSWNKYNEQSYLVNADLYLPVEELNF